MNINDLLFTNYQTYCATKWKTESSVWGPVDIAKEQIDLAPGLNRNVYFIKFQQVGGEEFYSSKDSQIYFCKNLNVESQLLGVVATLNRIGLHHFIAQIEGEAYSDKDPLKMDFNKYKINKIYLFPADYQKWIVPKLQNIFISTKNFDEKIGVFDFKRIIVWHSVIPKEEMTSIDVQKVCCNAIAVSINRSLTPREEKAFEAPTDPDFEALYLKRLVVKSDNLAFKNIEGHCWHPQKISISDPNVFENDRYEHYDGHQTRNINPHDFEFNRYYICKWTWVSHSQREASEGPMDACRADHIPYIVHRRSGYATGIYLLPKDYQRLMANGIYNSFDPSKKILTELDPSIVDKMARNFPSAAECIISQELWLSLYWNVLEIGHNRSLTAQERERLVPEKSALNVLREDLQRTVESGMVAIKDLIKTMGNKSEDLERLIRQPSISQEIFQQQEVLVAASRQMEKTILQMKEAQEKLLAISQ